MFTGGQRLETTQLATGFAFSESARWHDGRVWFVDMLFGRIHSVGLDGDDLRTELEVPRFLSGLGWLPDGTMLVVSMLDRKVLKVDGGEVEVYADLLTVADYHLNDMLVDGLGNAYVADFGYDSFVGAPSQPASVLRVAPDGTASVATPKIDFPNGMAITPDGATMIVAESWGDRLSAFERSADGTLGERRVWAELPGDCIPDGIALDAEGAVWVPAPGANALLRVAEGGELLASYDLAPRMPISAAFGGADGRTLLLCTTEELAPKECQSTPTASVECLEVEVAGAPLV